MATPVRSLSERSSRLLAGLVILAAALLDACATSGHTTAVDASGLPVDRPVRQSDLAGRPQAHLYFPGSVIEKHTGSNQVDKPHADEPDPAYVATVLTARTTAQRLLAWYDGTLTADGYARTGYFLPSNQSTGAAWAFHHRLQVQVGVLIPPAPAGEITYEVYLVGYAPGLPRY